MVFLNFFAIYFEFSITHREGMERNGTIIFIFSLSHPSPTYFGLKWSHNAIFLIFLLFFWNFLLRVGLERNGTIIFIFSIFLAFCNLFLVEMKPQLYFLIFWIFFAILLEFSLTRCVGTERNGTIIFIFSLSHPSPTYFGLK